MRHKLVLGVLLSALQVCAGEITGRVTLNDKPAAGVTVSALAVELPADQARREARREPRPAALAKAVTNAKGEFRIVFEAVAGEPGKLVSLACAGGGVASAWIAGRFDTADVDDAGEFAARRGVSLAGRVVDAAGKPLADVQVEHPAGPESVRTGADGAFAFEGVAESLDRRLRGEAGLRQGEGLEHPRRREGRLDRHAPGACHWPESFSRPTARPRWPGRSSASTGAKPGPPPRRTRRDASRSPRSPRGA